MMKYSGLRAILGAGDGTGFISTVKSISFPLRRIVKSVVPSALHVMRYSNGSSSFRRNLQRGCEWVW